MPDVAGEAITRVRGMDLPGIDKEPTASFIPGTPNPTRNRPFGWRTFPTFAESKEAERG